MFAHAISSTTAEMASSSCSADPYSRLACAIPASPGRSSIRVLAMSARASSDRSEPSVHAANPEASRSRAPAASVIDAVVASRPSRYSQWTSGASMTLRDGSSCALDRERHPDAGRIRLQRLAEETVRRDADDGHRNAVDAENGSDHRRIAIQPFVPVSKAHNGGRRRRRRFVCRSEQPADRGIRAEHRKSNWSKRAARTRCRRRSFRRGGC